MNKTILNAFDSKDFIVNLNPLKNLTVKDLNYILEKTKNEPLIGHIIFNKELRNNIQLTDLIKKIENQLTINNRKFETYSSDYTLCLIAKDSYCYSGSKQLKDDELTKEGWKYYTIRNEKDHLSVLYINDRQRQLVLSFQGIKINPLEKIDLFDEISSLINRAASYVDTDEFKLCKTPEQIENFVTPYLKNDKVFIDLKIAINLSENTKYHLTFTGYSFGALHAEKSAFFSQYYFKKVNTRAVTFDSPGSLELIQALNSFYQIKASNFDDLNIVNYPSSPNLFMNLYQHAGKILLFLRHYRLDNLEHNFYPMCEKGLDMILLRFRDKNFSNEDLYTTEFLKDPTEIKLEAEIHFYDYLFQHVGLIYTDKKIIMDTDLIEINEYEEAIFPNLKLSIDFYLVKLENFKPINHKNISDDLLSRQMYQLKSLYLTKTLNKTTFVVSKARIEKIQSIKQRLQRLIDIGSKLKYERNDFSDFVNQIAPVKCKS